MKESLKDLILDYINHQDSWIPKGQIYMFAQQEGYSPEGAGREARRLAEEEKIQVDYYKGKRNQKLARYARLEVPKKVKPKVEIIIRNGVPIALLR